MAEEEKKDTLEAGSETTTTSGSEDTKTTGSEDRVEIVDEKVRPKIKPVLDSKAKDLIEKKRAKKVPEFKRQEWFRYKRLGDHWRKPRGLHSKMRANKKYRPPMARVGYRTPAAIRDLHPSGFMEVMVHNVADLENINPEKEAARIGRTVGNRKRIQIIERADTMNIRILNRRGL
jgi:large subunit ribosomal protein L32e